MNQFPDASLLLHPNIPKPLHGVNPRTIKGQAWWDEQKKLSKMKYGNRCYACGVSKYDAEFHQWLEAHEHYEVNYETGRMIMLEIVALCHVCHNFIHNGRLLIVTQKEEGPEDKFWTIMHRGFKLLTRAMLPLNPFALWSVAQMAEHCGNRTPKWARSEIIRPLMNKYPMPEENEEIAWGDWRLEFEGALYKPKFLTMEAWARHYGREVETEVVIGRRSNASNFDEYLTERDEETRTR